MGVRQWTGAPPPVQYGGLWGKKKKKVLLRELGLISNNPQEVLRLTSLPYELYLQSDWWIKRRKRAILLAKSTCQNCGATHKRLDVHHLSYDRLGAETDQDLKAICRPCHELLHLWHK